MKSSAYNIFWYSKDLKKYILYNTYSNAVEAFAPPTAKIIRNVLKNNPCMGSVLEQAGVGAVSQHLFKNGFLIDQDRNEFDEIVFRYKSNKFGTSHRMAIAIAPSMTCNFDCVYCYASIKNGNLMSDEILEILIQQIKDAIITQSLQNLSIAWIGGEPLCNIPAIRKISTELYEFCKCHDCKFSTTIVTNGSLFTDKVTHEMSNPPFNLSHIQITLDSFMHEQTRPFRSRKGSSLEATLNGIKNAAKYFPNALAIRVNVPNEDWITAQKVGQYMHNIAASLDLPDSVTIYSAPVDPSTDEAKIGVKKEWDTQAFLKLQKDALKEVYGSRYRPFLPYSNMTACGYEIMNNLCVDADGYIYKCWHHIGHPDLSFGSIRNGMSSKTLLYSKNYQQWAQWDPTITMCKKCKMLPMCMGKCFDFAFTRGANTKGRCNQYRFTFKNDCVKYAEYVIKMRTKMQKQM